MTASCLFIIWNHQIHVFRNLSIVYMICLTYLFNIIVNRRIFIPPYISLRSSIMYHLSALNAGKLLVFCSWASIRLLLKKKALIRKTKTTAMIIPITLLLLLIISSSANYNRTFVLFMSVL